MKVQNVTPLGDIPNNALIFLLSASDPNLFMSCTNLMPGEGKCKTILNTKSTEKYNQFRLIKHVDGSIALQNVSGRYLSCDRYWRNHDQTWESFSVNVATISKDKLTETIELISNYTHEKFTVDQNGTWSIRLAEAPTISLLSLKSTCISFRNESFNNLDSLTVDLVRSIYRATQEIGFFLAIGHRISMDLMPEIQDEVGKLPYKFDPENKKGYKENEMLMEAKHDELKYGNSRVISNSKERADLVHKYFLKCTRLSEDLLFLLAHAEEMVTGVVPHWKGVFTDVDKRYLGLRCIKYYPGPLITNDGHPFITTSQHTDNTWITLLAVDNIGLECKNREGEWIHVPFNPHALIVNLGNVFPEYTNLFTPVCHRVVRRVTEGRISIPFFYDWIERKKQGIAGGC